jgi:hypothetical protein
VVGIAAAWLTGHYWAPFGSGTTLAAVGNGALGGFSGGLASSGGDLKAAFQGAVTGGAFGYVGTFSNPLANYAGHALVGCASGAMSGGGGEGCARGAVSQVISKWVTVETRGLDSKALQFAAATMTGGAVSAISGGKFATGAQTAAFGYLFNELSHYKGTPEERLALAGYDSGPGLKVSEATARTWGSYLPGTEAGDSAAQYWADLHVKTGNPLYAAPGVLASLWTPDTAMSTAITLGTAGAGSALGQAAGPLQQWIRLGPSYSRAGGFQVDMSIRWGASPARGGIYIQQIPSTTLQNVNQWLRSLRIPGGGWRSADPGHFHLW